LAETAQAGASHRTGLSAISSFSKMKPLQKIFASVLFVYLLAGIVSVRAQSEPIDIILNGIIAIGDDHRAFFIAAGGNFSLTEGQSRYGIKLLTVKTSSGCVQIENRGQVQTIHIRGTPNVAFDAASHPVIVKTSVVNADGSVQDIYVTNLPSNYAPLCANALGVAANETISSAANQTSATQTAVDDNAEVTNAKNSATDNSANGKQVYQWWMQEAQKIEQARMDTASRVMAGEWQPYPLTPLTPTGTSPALIGPDSVFMDHGPGIIISSN
jgi:hypothetical protein